MEVSDARHDEVHLGADGLRLGAWLGYTPPMTTTVPSISEALKDYRIDPENVWVVFIANSPDAQARGRPPIAQPLYLADAGDAGRKQIESFDGEDPYYLGTFSFLEIKAALDGLGEQPILEAQIRGLGKLLPSKTHFIPVSLDTKVLFYQVKAASLKDAVEFIQQRHPEGRVGIGGTRQDVEALVERMEKAIERQNFCAIEIDRRGPIKTWDADRLLFAKKNPSMAESLIPYPEQYETAN